LNSPNLVSIIWKFKACGESRREFLRLRFKCTNIECVTGNGAIFRSWMGGKRTLKRECLTFMVNASQPLYIARPWQVECPRLMLGCVNIKQLVLEEFTLRPEANVVPYAYGDGVSVSQPEKR
jgi:hypothetical protein